MKLFRKLSTALALLLVLSLTSCESFFFNNLFAGARPKPKPAEMSTSELKASLKSEFFMNQVASDPTLREEVKTVLKTTYEDPSTPPAEQELAAATYATVVIKSDLAANHVVNSAVLAIASVTAIETSAEPAAEVANVMTSILPADITAAIGSPTPPQAFIDMLATFTSANSALTTLGNAASGGQFETTELTDSDKLALAVSATVSTFVTAVAPQSGYEPAEAIWLAISNPASASTYINMTAFSIDMSAGSPLDNLFAVAGIAF